MNPAAVSFRALDRTCTNCEGRGEVDHCPGETSDCSSCDATGQALAYCSMCEATIGESGLTGLAVSVTRDPASDGAIDYVCCASPDCLAQVLAEARLWAGDDVPVVRESDRRAA